MTAVSVCIEKHRAELDPEDLALVEKAAAEFKADGLNKRDAHKKAIDEVIALVQKERAALLEEIPRNQLVLGMS